MLLDGRTRKTAMPRHGEDETVLMIMNSFEGAVAFRLPQATGGSQWSLLVDTNIPDAPPGAMFAFASSYDVTGRSLLLFSLVA
jgi:glycogen operon protein